MATACFRGCPCAISMFTFSFAAPRVISLASMAYHPLPAPPECLAGVYAPIRASFFGKRPSAVSMRDRSDLSPVDRQAVTATRSRVAQACERLYI